MAKLNLATTGKSFLTLLICVLAMSACKEDSSIKDKVNFNRKAMLTHWADHIVLPAFQNFANEVNTLNTLVAAYTQPNGSGTLSALRQQFKQTYLAFEQITCFEMGPSAEVSLRASLNTFPADTAKIASNISSKNYNLSAASQLDARGFPAMDYLLFGHSMDIEHSKGAKAYLQQLMQDMLTLTTTVNQNWQAERESFIAASGTDLGSSLGQMVNSLNKDYEGIKNAKVGFPAGKRTLGKPYPYACEAYYSGYSIDLAIANIQAIHNFYKGIYFDASQNGPSLQDYLEALDAQYGSAPLDQVIDDQFSAALQALRKVPNPFSDAVINHKSEVDSAYLEIQRNVILLKTDLPSALGVLITYQDNDGD